ncbi:hypothetical protein ACWD4G_07355 [Streptomyces sp. NPDC002643]
MPAMETRGSGAVGRFGTGASSPVVDVVDDSYRFDLSGDVPATDASSRAPPALGARALPNRESVKSWNPPPGH